MPGRLSQHLLAVLQFTRMAMVFTAISNAQAAILLRAASMAGPDGHYLDFLSLRVMFWAALVSSALYGFGMSLNDIIDRRRDAQLAADRPLPSGRLGLGSAHVLCMMLLAVAGLAGVMLSRELPRGTLTLILVAGVSCLIIVYDVAGKYLISLGLLSLGLIRFFHAAIPAPTLPMPWHPLLLLNHVAILSMVAYQWEQKRPTLTPRHFAITLAGLAAVNATIIAALGYRFADRPGDWLSDLALRPGLLAPALAVVVFVLIAHQISRRHESNPRAAGKTLMLVGLLWLIVYDAAFVAAFVDWKASLLIAMLLPLSYLSVRLMRAAQRLIELSQKPAYMKPD
jgi:4-hydroxybenzoate polyprenyltransferase